MLIWIILDLWKSFFNVCRPSKMLFLEGKLGLYFQQPRNSTVSFQGWINVHSYWKCLAKMWNIHFFSEGISSSDERYIACYEKHGMSFTRDWTLQEMVYQHTATEGTEQGNCTVINCKRTNEGLIRVPTGKEAQKKGTELKGWWTAWEFPAGWRPRSYRSSANSRHKR